MRRLQRVMALLLAFGLGCDKPKPQPEGDVEFARKAAPRPAAPVAADKKPWPAGPLVQGPIHIGFSVYGLPNGTQAPVAAAKAVRAATFPHLREGEEAEKTQPAKDLDLLILSPPVAEHAPPDLETLKYFGRGVSEEQGAAVQKTEEVALMAFFASTDNATKIHTDAIAMAAEVAKKSGGLIWDEDTRELFSVEKWKRRQEKPLTDLKRLPAHFTIHSYRKGDGGLVRLVTLGLSKFGIPNLVIEDVPATTATSMADVINATAATMVRDGRLKEAGKLAITADIVGVKTLAGAVGKATLHLVEGSKEDGDPEGPLVEIAFPGPASSVHERQGKLIDTLFGSEDAVTHVEHDEELLAASAAAKKELMKLKPRFSKGQTNSVETLEVKAPFETSSGGTEWMWVEVTAWEGSTIRGILQNDPFQVPGLEAGAKVEVAEDSIFDYIHTNPDGSVAGNTTAKLLERQGR